MDLYLVEKIIVEVDVENHMVINHHQEEENLIVILQMEDK
jgi:hypothetical protein